jgi:hypothetical protein
MLLQRPFLCILVCKRKQIKGLTIHDRQLTGMVQNGPVSGNRTDPQRSGLADRLEVGLFG